MNKQTVSVPIGLQPMPVAGGHPRGGFGYPTRYWRHVALRREAFAILAALVCGRRVSIRGYKRVSLASRRHGVANNWLKAVFEALPFDDAKVTEAVLQGHASGSFA